MMKNCRPGNLSKILIPIFLIIFSLFLSLNISRAQEQKPVTSAAEIDYPPFCIVNEKGMADGFSVELMSAALAAMGREVSFKTGTWPEVKSRLEKGEIQALPLVGRTPERELLFDFTFPYMTLHGAIVVQKKTTDINNIQDLRGRSVAVLKGDNAQEFLLREERGIEILTTDSFSDALDGLSSGIYEAVVMQRLLAVYLIQEKGLKDLKIISRPVDGFSQDFCFAVQEGDRDTLALLNEGLALVMADGTYRDLHTKWFSAEEPPSDRKIIIGGDHNYPPYEYLDKEGNPAGYNVELTKALAGVMGLNIEIRLGPWQDIMKAFEEGRIDVMQGLFYTPERDQKFDFSQSHAVNHYVVVTRKGYDNPPSNIEQLRSKNIVVQHGDVMHQFLVNNGLESELTLVDSHEDMLKELSKGNFDCAVAARISAIFLMENLGLKNLELGHNPLATMEYCYAVGENRKSLLARFTEGLKTLENSGEYRRLHEKWLGIYDEPLPLIRALRYSAMVTVPVALLLLIFFLWSWILRRQVSARTAQLSALSSRYQAILSALPDIVMEVDTRNIYTWANPAGIEFFGDDVLGKNTSEFFLNQEKGYAAVKTVGNDSVINVESWERRRDGEKRLLSWWCRILKDQNNAVKGALLTARDITSQKETAEALKNSEIRYRAIFENSLDAILLTIPDGTILEANPAACRMLGRTADEITRIGRKGIVDMSDLRLKKGLEERDKNGKASGELTMIRADGTKFPVEVSSVIYQDENNTKKASMIARDITKRIQDQERIVHLNTLLRAIRDINKLIVHEKDRGRLIHETCSLLVKSRGYSSALVILTNSQKKPELWAAEGIASNLPELSKMLKQDKVPPCLEYAGKLKGVLHFDESSIQCAECPIFKCCSNLPRLCVSLIYDNTIVGYLAVALDAPVLVTKEESTLFKEMADDLAFAISSRLVEESRDRIQKEHESLRQQMTQIQRLESVGRLAGGVAHDYNNMLSVIMGNAEFALTRLGPDDPLREELNEILDAGNRSVNITRQLLAFARKQTVAPEIVDLNESVAGTLKMLRRLIGENIELSWNPGYDLWHIKIDPSQIDQILANLCVNARDAITNIGRISIETGNMTFDKAFCSQHAGAVPGDYVLISVSDNGSGMDKTTLEIIFEPFFTTKALGEGTGLGLSTVYGIVKQNNGYIDVYSEVGIGVCRLRKQKTANHCLIVEAKQYWSWKMIHPY